MSPFMMNAWYVIANSGEIGEKPLARTILNKKLVIFRTASGEYGALLDRCPHRMAPLSFGEVIGETLRCGYHGLAFDPHGKCVSALLGTVPSGAKVQSFPVKLAHGLIWMWAGDPGKADPSQIPDFSFIDAAMAENRWVIHDYTHVQANYQIETDNLMDLSHIELIHRGTFGGRGVIQNGKFDYQSSEKQVDANWWMPSVPSPLPDLPKGGTGIIDHWLDMRWHAPSAMRLQLGYAIAGEVDPPNRESANRGFQYHILSPETEKTTHYFWGGTQSTDLMGEYSADMTRGALATAFQNEDKPILEAVQSNTVTDFWSEKPLSLKTDAGGVLARRALEKLIAAEEGALAKG